MVKTPDQKDPLEPTDAEVEATIVGRDREMYDDRLGPASRKKTIFDFHKNQLIEARKRKRDQENSQRTLEVGEYPKGQVAHTRGWEPGDPVDTPSIKILVDGVEQPQKPPEFDGVFKNIPPNELENMRLAGSIDERKSSIQALGDEVDRAGKVMGQASELLRRRDSKPRSDEPPSSFSVWVQRGALAVAAGLAWWLFDKFDAPVWLVAVTLIACLISVFAVRWLEKTRRRRNIFIASMAIYAVLAVLAAIVFRDPGTPSKPDWRRSDEAKQLASQMVSDVQKLEDEGRLIDLTDYHHAIKVYADWVEKCSVTLGRIDNQMRKFRRETTYRYYFEKSGSDTRKLLSDKLLNENRKILGDVIHTDVLALQAIEKALALDTSPGLDPNYPRSLSQ